ncbi:MAG: aldehyde dehydrogenase family protein [Sandaracinaceae bacterium]
MPQACGDYIGGRFQPPAGEPFASRDPAHDFAPVAEAGASRERVAEACAAAADAAPGWRDLGMDARLAHLARFRAALKEAEDDLSAAITREMGKVRSESRTEARALVARFGLVEAQVRADLRGGSIPGYPNESVRYAPHGVVAVLGPFNFPLHLCHAHVLPALLLGNAVVMKPSEVTPLAGYRYAEAAQRAGLPPGVLNVVQGGGAIGAALVAHPAVHGLAFTGSYATGRRIREAALDRPEMLVALELGGKNTCIVLEDADLRQAIHEIVIGAYLTTGQRCTCTDRVFVHRSRADALIDGLRRVVGELRFGDPEAPATFAGPLATERSRDRFLATVERARAAGADVILEGGPRPGGAFAAPSLHRLPDGVHDVPGYTDEETFGPDLSIEVVDDDDEVLRTLEASPYGFAHSVFTQDDARFARYRREVRCGILNRNRGTNLASSRLPFGGVKRSGNFRPAGAWAPRNLAYPVATLENPGRAIASHPHIAPLLPASDLDVLEARHHQEEEAEASRSVVDHPRPLRMRFPAGGRLPRSEALLERYYAGDRFPREKKPPVYDHLRSVGPWMVSVDDEPLSVLDAMSQTATLPAGFAPPEVVRAYVDGAFGATLLGSADSTLPDEEATRAFADLLRDEVPGLPTVSFASSGAEAMEKALALAALHAPPGAERLLAFEGSFHGRTLLALQATHNPAKRGPFLVEETRVTFAPFPRWDRPGAEPEDPPDWRALLGAGDVDALSARYGEDPDPLLRAEVDSLAAVGRALAEGGFFAVAVEPMQSEGGDNYATARFFRGLRLLTRAHGVPLLVDEVQTGFGLGGSFLWHTPFGLVDEHGRPDRPDAVTLAKRAQMGVVLSAFDDPERTFGYPASAVRGRLHAELLGSGEAACRVEGFVRPRLAALERRFGHRIRAPRARGFALAFDLDTPEELSAYLAQRFWRGAVVFAAGSRTVRYRLNAAFDEAAVEALFRSIHRSLAWLDAHPGKTPPAWEDPAPRPAPKPPGAWTVRVARPEEADRWMPRVLELEAQAYEPARRDPEERLRRAFGPDGVAIVAERPGPDGEPELVGSALACPLEAVADVAGVADDPMQGRHNTLYSMAQTVHPALRGQGLGRALKAAQIREAATRLTADGGPRYLYVTARNRLPDAAPMSRLSDRFGASTVAVLEHQYEGTGVARYYRLPVGGLRVAEPVRRTPDDGDLAQGLARPFAAPPPSLVERLDDGSLAGPAVTKITLLNYVTPAVVRATEWIAALAPEQPHLFLASGRDEALDKAVRLLRVHRPDARRVLSFEGAYVGHTTASARSLSDPAVHRQGRPWFRDWPRVPHPADVGAEASLAALRQAVGDEVDRFLGIVIEPVQERTGRVAPQAFWDGLAALRRDLGLPVVTVETAGAAYRAGRGPFATSGGAFDPDVRLWWTGGHLGLLHVAPALAVSKPMTLVSTWDGDELSLIQAHHQLRAARRVDVAAGEAALEAALAPARDAGLTVRGLGLYRVLDGGARGETLAAALAERGVRGRLYPHGAIAFAPSFDRALPQAKRLGAALADALRRGLAR